MSSTDFPAGLQVGPSDEPPYGSGVYPLGGSESLIGDVASDARSPVLTIAAKRPYASAKPPSRQASEYRPWTWGQVRVVDFLADPP